MKYIQTEQGVAYSSSKKSRINDSLPIYGRHFSDTSASYMQSAVKARCQPSEIINQLLAMVKASGFTCEVKLQSCFDDLVYVAYCPVWLKQALSEILINAISHNEEKVDLRICIKLSVFENTVSLVVEDNGKGFLAYQSNRIKMAALNHSKQVFAKYRILAPSNLLSIQNQLMNDGGSVEIISAKHFKTCVHLKIPLLLRTNASQLQDEVENSDFATTLAQKSYCNEHVLFISDSKLEDNNEQYFNSPEIYYRFNISLAKSLSQGLALFIDKAPTCIVVQSNDDLSRLSRMREWLNLSTRFALVPMLVILERDSKSEYLRRFNSGFNAVLVKPVNDKRLLEVVMSLIEEKRRFTELIAEGIANYHVKKLSLPVDNSFSERFYALLEKHYKDESLNKEKMANLLFMHEKTMSRRIQDSFDSNFTEVLRNYRLNKARALIEEGRSITDSAMSSGFNSPSYFARCFKSYFGFAPSLLQVK